MLGLGEIEGIWNWYVGDGEGREQGKVLENLRMEPRERKEGKRKI